MEAQELFRSDLASYITAYDFLSQLVNYEDLDLERLHAFAKCLLTRLRGQSDDEALDGVVRLAGYKIINQKDHNLSLESGEAKPMNPMGPGGGQVWDDPDGRLSVIIKKMNEVFSGNLSDADFLGYATTLIGKMVDDNTLLEQAKANNTVEAFSNGAYENKLTSAVVDALEGHNSMADQALKHPHVFKGLASLLLDEVYKQLREKADA